MAPSSNLGRIHPSDLLLVKERRPPGGMVLEMHAHSSDRSLDSGACAIALVEQAARRSLDGLCLTDHNAVWSERELREMSERFELIVLAGMELGTDAGHVLVYGLQQYSPELLVLERLRSIAEYEGAAMVLAHPMRAFYGRRPGWDEFPFWFDGVETINGDHSDTENGYLTRHAQQLGLATLGGSDAHSVDAVGRVGTVFPSAVRATEDIVSLIRSRRTAAVDFRPGFGAISK